MVYLSLIHIFKQKKNVTLAMLYMNYNTREQVIKFNRTNEEYRINIKTYVRCV